MLTIYGRRNSFNVQKVLWLVGELGLDHAHVPLGGAFGGLDDPSFRLRNPHGRIPVVDDEGVTVWESHAILRYLAARHGGERFFPSDAAARSHPDRWMDWAQSTLQPAFIDGVFVAYYRTPEEKRDWPAIRAAVARCAIHYAFLDRWLADRPFIAGDDLTLADIPAGGMLYRYFELDIERPPLPNVEAWYARLQERPAYRQHVMVPFAELKG
jgi:glutathione S-transferase